MIKFLFVISHKINGWHMNYCFCGTDHVPVFQQPVEPLSFYVLVHLERFLPKIIS